MKVLVYQFHKKDTFTMIPDGFRTIPVESYGNYWELSAKSVKKYADKWGFDYLFLNPGPEDDYKPFMFNETQFERYRSIEFLKNYDAVLYIDSDVLITPDADNIVDIYNDGYTNICTSTGLGAKILESHVKDSFSHERSIKADVGIMIFYKKSIFVNDLRALKIKTYGAGNRLARHITENLDPLTKWWENWEYWEPYIKKLPNHFYDDGTYLMMMLLHYNIPFMNLDHRIHNYQRMDTFKKEELFLSNSPQFLHFILEQKDLLKQWYNYLENFDD
jgi:hypothetical protein